jgi:transcriptional regulator with XRE-family HTH domain
MDNIPLKRRMRAWRDHRGLSQARTAEPLGWTSAAIGQIERGKADITVAKLAIICKRAFKTDLRTFFGPLPGRAA